MKNLKLLFSCTILICINAHALNLTIPSYPVESVIPNDFTFSGGGQCSGDNVSPQLMWDDIPQGTQSFAVVFIDENFDFLHWKLYNIDAAVTHIPENNPNNVGTEGLTNFGINGYGGPCPPSPNPGNYVMTVYAVNTIFATEPSVTDIQNAAIESASWLAFRDINDDQARYEYMARYRLTFQGQWTNSSHPIDFPVSAHFAALAGNTHRNDGFIWRDQGMASDAMEEMAESGATADLQDEIMGIINSSGAEYMATGGNNGATGSVQLEFDISASHPLFSMVSMIAPSPDWFVGVKGLDLRENGEWRETFTVDLLPYDAGTDSGVTFLSDDENTAPRAPIQRITTNPFPNNVPLGQFVFERLSVSGTPDLDTIFADGFD
ncbi:YbhB/YbcL family Raf kinase inhibitor-like protein [Marinicella sp. W31]|uniref:YbhB/YbcL family Raf kinase inhibitor-like protein n=1 Tax=Marinicella sp. W31 TaxID=3023713 RepID=UPI00375661D8